MSLERCSCLIPFHNERDRILAVWITGLEREMFMIKNMLDYGGIETYVKQFLDVARERVPEHLAAGIF